APVAVGSGATAALGLDQLALRPLGLGHGRKDSSVSRILLEHVLDEVVLGLLGLSVADHEDRAGGEGLGEVGGVLLGKLQISLGLALVVAALSVLGMEDRMDLGRGSKGEAMLRPDGQSFLELGERGLQLARIVLGNQRSRL